MMLRNLGRASAPKVLLSSLRRSMGTGTDAGAAIDKAVKVTVNVNVSASGERLVLAGYAGESLQGLAVREEDLLSHMPCTCGGNAACSTCHVYIDSEYYGRLAAPEEEELDMLDMAWGYEEKRSRLGCCIRLSPAVEGMEVHIPEESNNFF
jgi:ferredoxin